MDRIRLLTIIGVGTFFAAALYFMTGKSPFPAIGVGALLAVLAVAVTSLPKRRKTLPDLIEQKPKGRKTAPTESHEISPVKQPAKNRDARRKKRK